MKIAYLLIFIVVNNFSMDFTTPNPLPRILRDDSSHHDAMPVILAKAREDEKATIDVRQHKRHSREHSVVQINASITEADGKETKLDLKKDGTLTTSADSDETKKSYSKTYVVVSNTITGSVIGLLGLGATLAIKYGDCNK